MNAPVKITFCSVLATCAFCVRADTAYLHYTGVVVHVSQECFVLKEKSGMVSYVKRIPTPIQRGDIVEVEHRRRPVDSDEFAYTVADKHRIIGTCPISLPQPISIKDLNHIEPHLAYIVTTGDVDKVFRDEIDSKWLHAILIDGGESIIVSIPIADNKLETFADLLDARIEIKGCSILNHFGNRLIGGMRIETSDLSDVKVIKSASANSFDVPELPTQRHITVKEVFALGIRRATGRVLARWKDNFLIRLSNGCIVRVEPAFGLPMPAYGETVEVSGRATTDMFRINLIRARWRRSEVQMPDDKDNPIDMDARALVTDKRGGPGIRFSLYGTLVRLSGRVIRMPSANKDGWRMAIVCNGVTVPIDASETAGALDGLKENCVVDVTGVYIFDTSNMSPGQPMPHIHGFALVPRTADDIHIISQPPWLTPTRLLGAICALVVALLAIIFWNRSLNRLANRRGEQLFREQIAHAGADLRVEERTRLAVELHDSLSQNLSGVGFQITAAKSKQAKNPEESRRHLDTAERMLKSCRTELRRCLWDLREDTLAESDFQSAVSKTVNPVSGNASISIHISIPRTLLSDTTAHAILRILRELVANAVTHGKATQIRITGARKNGNLSFSVSDNGCGFDPLLRPGAASGHFGLAGIEERLTQCGGTFTLESAVGKGTHAVATIPVHHESNTTAS